MYCGGGYDVSGVVLLYFFNETGGLLTFYSKKNTIAACGIVKREVGLPKITIEEI